MKLAAILATLLLVNTAHADCSPDDFECGLTVANLGDTGGPELKNQVRYEDTKTPKVIGATLGIAGGLSLVASWTVYIARANYRLQPRYTIGQMEIDHFETLGAWSLYTGIGASVSLTASEYLLLPEAQGVPVLAWLGGAVGLGTAAVGVGYAVGGSSCSPIAVRPGANIPQGCLSGTADSLLGPLLLLTSVPLLNLPLTYLFRDAFADDSSPLTIGPGSITGRIRF